MCTVAEKVKQDAVAFVKNIDWKGVLKTSAYVAGEFFSVNDIYRVVTGIDPLTGEKAGRLEAAAWLTADVLSLGASKIGKVAKVATKANKLVDVVKGAKIVKRANKALDTGKAFVKSNINKLLDTPFAFGFEMVTNTGHSLQNTTTLREVGQNAKKGFDNLVQAFAKNGDEVVEGTGKGSDRIPKSVNNMNEFLASDFGKELGEKLQKTKKRYDGESIYKVTENFGDLRKGDQIYLDRLHKDHLEVFDKRGKLKNVLNLDGTPNADKLSKAGARRLP